MGAGALAGAAMIAMGRASAQEGPKLRVGLIGGRNRGHQVAGNFLKSGQFDIKTIADCDTAMIDRALKELGTALPKEPVREQDFRKVLDDPDIDAVILATPDHWHGVMAVMAMDAGKHVYVEKPASHSLRDGAAMVAAHVAHPELTVMVGSQQRSGQHFHDARQFIQDGGLGKVGFARAWVTHNRGILSKLPAQEPPTTMDYDMWLGPAPFQKYEEQRVHYNWRFIRDFGTGEMGNWGAHWLDIVRWYLDLDMPISAMGTGGQYVVKDAKEWPDTQTILYQYPDLTVEWELRLWTKYSLNGNSTGAEFGGDKGSLVVTRGGWTFYPRDGEPVEHGSSEMEVAHATNFAKAIRGEAAPAAPIEEGVKTAALCHLGNISSDLNRRIAYNPTSGDFGSDKAANDKLGRAPREPWSLES